MLCRHGCAVACERVRSLNRLDMSVFRQAKIRVLNRAAPLDPTALMDTSLRRCRRMDFADRTFTEPLGKLISALQEEAELSAFGQLAVRFDALRCLDNQLHLDAAEEADPGVLERRIVRPIFITALPRSGSTFLHSLLALDQAVVVPRSWQLIYPYPSRRMLGRRDNRRQRVARQFALFRLLSPELVGMHPLEADTPQECTDITAQVFQSLRFDTTYRIPSYRDWMDRNGHDMAYRFHRRFLQHLDAQSAPGKRWVLKSPDHVFALDALCNTYPDAHIVMLHRDPLSVLASVAKLTEILRRPFTRSVDRAEIGEEISARWAEGAERMVAIHSSPNRILHLHYRDLVASPMSTVAALYRHCGMTLSTEAEARMIAFLRARPRGGYSVHRHRLEEFGLEATELRSRFARYRETFDAQAESSNCRGERHLSARTA